ncbi:hydrogen peroxide-dependent heme synthase [Corynebacterium sp. AOP40-9SA-29]|uniref:hydrogen peroxide-dependent heme synthase n=1 Tax=Corynebacterium sp. AOP40-9SA-29 TaxID=3457677 RepID=UPI0040332633
MAKLDFRELNEKLQYTMWSVFTVRNGELPEGEEARAAVAEDFASFLASYDDAELTVRGVYDLTGQRAEADIMIWWHAEKFEDLQRAYRRFLKETTLGRACDGYWSNSALHRPAEFNKSHLPSFIMGEDPAEWIAVYPFVRSFEWYLLPDQERRTILAEHGMAARGFDEVRANTVPAFALGDYEWILAFESPTLDRIVDLMYKMRYTEARRHVREEVPFFTGRRVNADAEDLAGFIAELP